MSSAGQGSCDRRGERGESGLSTINIAHIGRRSDRSPFDDLYHSGQIGP